MRTLAKYAGFAAMLVAGIGVIGAARAVGSGDDAYLVERQAQIAELEQQIHVTFHAAVSVHDPVNGDSADVITHRIRDVLSIWAEDGEITIIGTSATSGNYIGQGDPDDPATCPTPSGDYSRQGTLCTLYKYVAGGLQADHKWVSLTPAYKTQYEPAKDADGQWTSSVYFECHYFDVSLDPATGLPLWTAKSHVNLVGQAKEINGRWLLTKAKSTTVGIPIPSQK